MNKPKLVDYPISKRPMKVYLAGYMSGAKLKECTEWRKGIRSAYSDYKGHLYPLEFLDPFNGPELDSIDAKGLKSCIPANAIFNGDKMSVKACDLVIANLDTFGETRPMIGTFFELGWCTAWDKPFVLIANEFDKEVLNGHPFLKQASAVFSSVEELVASKTLNYFYKRINGAVY